MYINVLSIVTQCIITLLYVVYGDRLGTCILQGDPQSPVLYDVGDFIIGGAFTIHYYLKTEKHTYTMRPQSLECSGRLDIYYQVIVFSGL